MRNVTDLRDAIYHGAVKRVRPKAMTAAVIIAGLLPILWSHGAGADVMKRIATPMIGGVVTSTSWNCSSIPRSSTSGDRAASKGRSNSGANSSCDNAAASLTLECGSQDAANNIAKLGRGLRSRHKFGLLAAVAGVPLYVCKGAEVPLTYGLLQAGVGYLHETATVNRASD